MAEIELTAKAVQDDGSRYALRMAWLTGEGAGGVEFQLSCGAGLGSPWLELTVDRGEQRYSGRVDIREVVQQWVDAVVAQLDSEAV